MIEHLRQRIIKNMKHLDYLDYISDYPDIYYFFSFTMTDGLCISHDDSILNMVTDIMGNAFERIYEEKCEQFDFFEPELVIYSTGEIKMKIPMREK